MCRTWYGRKGLNKYKDHIITNMENSTSWEDIPPRRPRLSEVNSYITCMLCRGYLVDATTIVECLHSFCRSCIIQHLNVKCYCPICELMINMAKPNIKPDKALQDIVYKLVPGLFEREMGRRRLFYEKHPKEAALASPEQRGEDMERLIFSPDDKISLSLEMTFGSEVETLSNCSSDSGTDSASFSSSSNYGKRYLECPAKVKISHLKKFLIHKYDIDTTRHNVNVLYKRVPLPEFYTLMDTAYIYTWKRNEPMRFFYNFNKIITSLNDFDIFKCTESRETSDDNMKLNKEKDDLKIEDINNYETGPVTQNLEHINVKEEERLSVPVHSSNENNDNINIRMKSQTNSEPLECLPISSKDDVKLGSELDKSQFLELMQLIAKKDCLPQKDSTNGDVRRKTDTNKVVENQNSKVGNTTDAQKLLNVNKISDKLTNINNIQPCPRNVKTEEKPKCMPAHETPLKKKSIQKLDLTNGSSIKKKISGDNMKLKMNTENKKSLIEILKFNLSATMAKAKMHNISNAKINTTSFSKVDVPVKPVTSELITSTVDSTVNISNSDSVVNASSPSSKSKDKSSKRDIQKAIETSDKCLNKKLNMDNKPDDCKESQISSTLDIVSTSGKHKNMEICESQILASNSETKLKSSVPSSIGQNKSSSFLNNGVEQPPGKLSLCKQISNDTLRDNIPDTKQQALQKCEKNKDNTSNLTLKSNALIQTSIGSSQKDLEIKNDKHMILTSTNNPKKRKWESDSANISKINDITPAIDIKQEKTDSVPTPSFSYVIKTRRIEGNNNPSKKRIVKLTPDEKPGSCTSKIPVAIKEETTTQNSTKLDLNCKKNELRNLIDSGYFKLPSSLSISLTESKDLVQPTSSTTSANEMSVTEVKYDQMKAPDNKKGNPVNNYIEILKLPEPNTKADDNITKTDPDIRLKSPGPVPYLKPLDTKIPKSSPPQTFQQTFLQSLQQIDALRFNRNKTEQLGSNRGVQPKFHPENLVQSKLFSEISSLQNSPRTNIICKPKTIKSDKALDLSSPSSGLCKLAVNKQVTKAPQAHNNNPQKLEIQMPLEPPPLIKLQPATSLINSTPGSSPLCEYSRPSSTSTLVQHPYKQVSKQYSTSKNFNNMDFAATHLTPFAQQAFLYQQLKINQLETTFSTAAMLQFVRSLQSQNQSSTNAKKPSQQHGNVYSPKS